MLCVSPWTWTRIHLRRSTLGDFDWYTTGQRNECCLFWKEIKPPQSFFFSWSKMACCGSSLALEGVEFSHDAPPCEQDREAHEVRAWLCVLAALLILMDTKASTFSMSSIPSRLMKMAYCSSNLAPCRWVSNSTPSEQDREPHEGRT